MLLATAPLLHHARRVASILGAAGAVLLAAGCDGREVTTEPEPIPSVQPPSPAPPELGFPDSIATGRGLPPAAEDSTVRMVGGDTLLVTSVSVFPAAVYAPSQVAPGAPTAQPMRIEVRALARDTSASVLRERPLPWAQCPVVLRLWRATGDGRERAAPPVWRSDRAAGSVACPTVRRYINGADVNVGWEVPALLGDSLPAGRYLFGVTVRLADGRTFEYAPGGAYLTADVRPPTRDRSTLRMSARAEVVGAAPRVLRTTAVVINVGPRPVAFEHGACAVWTRLYRAGAGDAAPVWRSEYRRPPGSTVGYACPLPLYLRVLAPGDSAVFVDAAPLGEVLADSLPAGRYRVVAELTLLDDDLPPSQWRSVHRLEAGTVELTRAADRLPGSRLIDGLAYVATTRLIRGATPATDTVRTLVLVTNTTSARVVTQVGRDCPVMPYAYRSAALRDSVPIQPPVANGIPAARRCSSTPHAFALGAGESWTFHVDVPAAELVARAGPGRLYFTAWLSGRPSVTLAAGDLELR